MSWALGRPLQKFFEPLDYVAISPTWLVGVLFGMLIPWEKILFVSATEKKTALGQ
jgi:hypothetical protein